MKEENISDLLKKNICQVCEFSGSFVEIGCPNNECREIFRFLGEEYSLSTYPISCSACGYQVDNEELADILDLRDDYARHKHWKFRDDIDNMQCVSCESIGGVINHNDAYICTNCLYITEDIDQCSRCGQYYNAFIETAFDCTGCYAYFLSQ